jgi:hypothetical protein
VASKRFSPQKARLQLKQLIQQAAATEPNLAQKLTALAKWIENKKDGLLTSKPYVLDLLTEVILDAELWLVLRSFSSEERQQFYEGESFSVTEQYWLEVLFTRWVNEQDRNFPTWRREVMNGNFKRDDEDILRDLSREITGQGGSALWKHLLDLSMATDLLTSGRVKASLCVQLTTNAGQYLTEKQTKWEATLMHWGIERGLLVSYNPMEDLLVPRLIVVILRYSDSPTAPCYTVIKDL